MKLWYPFTTNRGLSGRRESQWINERKQTEGLPPWQIHLLHCCLAFKLHLLPFLMKMSYLWVIVAGFTEEYMLNSEEIYQFLTSLTFKNFFFLSLKETVHHSLPWTRSSDGEYSSENRKWRESGKKPERAAYYAPDQSLKVLNKGNKRWKKDLRLHVCIIYIFISWSLIWNLQNNSRYILGFVREK